MRKHRISIAAVAIVVAVTLNGCSVDELCRAPGDACPCTSTAQGDTTLVVLTDYASPAFVAAIQRLTIPNAIVFDEGELGLSRAPIVILATYDANGSVTEVAAYNLGGEGQTRARKKADAELAAACLSDAAASIASDAPAGNLLRALPTGSALAAARGQREAAVLAFGLGRSSLDDATMDQDLPVAQIDLTTTDARTHVIDVLHRIGLVPVSDLVSISLMDPDESVVNSVSAGYINQFAEGPLCDAIAADRCQVLEVLP